ncbi:MAG: hypothetical protein AB2689_00050 [Candidatus Thiodiazotropha taylori]
MSAVGGILTFLAMLGSAYGSNRASQSMQDAADSELQLQWDQYLQNRSDAAPYRESGNAAIGQLSSLLGLPTPQQDANQRFNADAYQRAYEAYNRNQGNSDFGSRSLLYFDPWRHYQEYGTQFANSAGSWGIDLEGAAFGADTEQYQRPFDHQAYQQAYEEYNRQQGTPDFSSREMLYESPAEHYQQYGRKFQGAAERRGINLEQAAFGDRMSREELDALQEPAEETATPSGNQAQNLTEFFESPGYNFNLAETLRANEARQAARGRLNSTATDRSNARYASNLASNEYLNYTNQLNALAGIGQIANQNVINQGTRLTESMGNAIRHSGNARASSYLGMANTMNSAANNYMNHRTYTDLATLLYGNNSSSTYNSTNGYNGEYDDFYTQYGNL